MPSWTGDPRASGEAVRLRGAVWSWPPQQLFLRRLSLSYRSCRQTAKGAYQANSSWKNSPSSKRWVMILRPSIERIRIWVFRIRTKLEREPRTADHNHRNTRFQGVLIVEARISR